MKLIHQSDITKTIAHDSVVRQQFIAPGDLNSSIQTVNYVELAPGESFTKHSHPDCEECFFIIEGELTAEVTEKKFTLRKGDFLAVQAGEEHYFINNSAKVCKYLQFRVLM